MYVINKTIPVSVYLAWTTAAVDQKRVIGATPIVMDMLNLQKVENSIHYLKTYFYYSYFQ